MARVMLLLTFVAVILGSVEVRSEDTTLEKTITKRATACYEPLGCFSNDGPFISSKWPLTFVPDSPDKIQTTFLLFTRESGDTPQQLDARYPALYPAAWTNLKVRPTKILSHGFLESFNLTPWWKDTIKELLTHGDYNVIYTDWSGGNRPPYTQAAANTRIVGAQIAELVKVLVAEGDFRPLDFHIIGISLGSHVAGYAGERIPGLGRITGLDPAGPYFEDTDKSVRLDDTDALFVDIIHTDAKSLLRLGFGTKTTSGHVDFYPNLGHEQPGCSFGILESINIILQSGIAVGSFETVMCSHVRSLHLFTESINSPCPFVAYPCASEEDFVNNLCHSCANGGCARMGFHANKNDASAAKYYLTTGGSRPFCRFHFIVTINLSENVGSKQQGTLDLVISGDDVKRSQVSLTGDPETFETGQSYKFYITLPHDVGNVQSLTLLWTRVSSGFFADAWNFITWKTKSLFMDEISIYREEAGVDAHFCAGGRDVPSGGDLTVDKKC